MQLISRKGCPSCHLLLVLLVLGLPRIWQVAVPTLGVVSPTVPKVRGRAVRDVSVTTCHLARRQTSSSGSSCMQIRKTVPGAVASAPAAAAAAAARQAAGRLEAAVVAADAGQLKVIAVRALASFRMLLQPSL